MQRAHCVAHQVTELQCHPCVRGRGGLQRQLAGGAGDQASTGVEAVSDVVVLVEVDDVEMQCDAGLLSCRRAPLEQARLATAKMYRAALVVTARGAHQHRWVLGKAEGHGGPMGSGWRQLHLVDEDRH